jgi:hypothetical protein
MDSKAEDRASKRSRSEIEEDENGQHEGMVLSLFLTCMLFLEY